MSYSDRRQSRRAGLGDVPPASQLGRIVARDGWSYQITPADLLWLTRSIDCEGGNEAATAWTYAQRLANRHGSSLTSMVQAHSQPINPIWAAASASGCLRSPDRCSPASLARRAQCANKPWDALENRDLITRWAQGGVPNPVPRATDFADAQVSQSFMNRNPGTQVVLREGNWYLSEGPNSAPRGGSVAWPADFVTIDFQGRRSSVSLLAGVPSYVPWLVASGVGALVLGGVAVYTMRPRRAA